MAINVTLGEAQTQEKDFPKLMKSTNTGAIVYFTKKECGVVIVDGMTDKFTSPSDRWAMEYFTDYNEPIILQNK